MFGVVQACGVVVCSGKLSAPAWLCLGAALHYPLSLIAFAAAICRWEACQHGHDDCVDLLLRYNGS